MAEYSYVDVITALPHLRDPFHSDQTPISRLQLTKRLSSLDHDDRQKLNSIAKLLYWGQLDIETRDADLIRTAQQLKMNFSGMDFLPQIEWRMDLRFVVACLRYRHEGRSADELDKFSRYSIYAHMVRKQWGKNDFGLSGKFPWVVTAKQMLEDEDAFGLERLLMQTVWKYYDAAWHNHQYDFNAILLYTLRWDLVDRWTSYSHPAAQRRFEKLLQEGIAQAKDRMDIEI
ncbi:Uncharacterised protein [BD1-7 clade bacterium]|uniref:Uncharacterized protein n=1 Tax=BD1-7 clade bacterium TaxID=2029982 RepID=A0A5S9QGF9_9GAMM|nr:Uncharacterised protein [BD1-7 clade bacterium]CAA0117135.1 Uncharacterised protein [BD1-7 clade bacterium]